VASQEPARRRRQWWRISAGLTSPGTIVIQLVLTAHPLTHLTERNTGYLETVSTVRYYVMCSNGIVNRKRICILKKISDITDLVKVIVDLSS
jgi:hypothetical protein